MSRMTRRRASRIRCMVIVLAAAAAGACSAPPYYETAADFEEAVRGMNLVGEPMESATARLAGFGFDCKSEAGSPATCRREADNVLCAQRQVVKLVNRPGRGFVEAFEVTRGTAPDQLPGRCLSDSSPV